MINLYTTSTIGNYKTGTVTCTKNSPAVTGTGTTWKEIVNPGDILTLDDDKFYIISAVNSNTSLTLDKNFAENTATNVSYRILLNTAAHFPSDTAAKVERALEQLSDINEAAINNDRTVTAATKVNGKGITSVMGNLDLNPTSVNANQGGCIYFHYNQSANNTAAIFEHQQGLIRINGDFYVNGNIRSSINITNSTPINIHNMDSSSQATQRQIRAFEGEETNQVGEILFYSTQNSADHSVRLRAFNNNVYNDLTVGVSSSGNKYALTTTPSTNSNNSQIATTQFVNNRLVDLPRFLNFENATVPSGAWYILGEYTFPTSGYYLLSLLGMFPNNGTGYRVISMRRDGNAGDAMDKWSSISEPAVNGATTKLLLTRAHGAAAGDTLTFCCYQNSGSTLSVVYSGLAVQRLKETF